MWRFFRKTVPPTSVPLYLYNTLTKKKEPFEPHAVGKDVRMYNCGPTVYGKQHIGNLSMFVFADILRRTLEYNRHKVKQVINITDVGHLTSDADEGEDKMTKGLKRDGLEPTLENMKMLAEKYTQIFLDDIAALNIDTSKIVFPRASEHISTQIAMIETLEQKGYAYPTKDAVYYDTTRFPSYGALGGIDLAGLKEGARAPIADSKRHPTDFALWKLDDKIGWDSPWGKGFPGWHIECSAMIRKTLGEQIDIHTGGIEHVSIHHNNEMAQSEAVTGKKPLSRFWMHRAHIQIDGGKIAKSDGLVIYLSNILSKNFHPMALRYLFLGAHYRTNSNFSWEALEAAQTAYLRLRAFAQSESEQGSVSEEHSFAFRERMNDDLDTPGALSHLWAATKDASLSPADIRATLLDADRVLGLGLGEIDAKADALAMKATGRSVLMSELPSDIVIMIEDREKARSEKNWTRADELRSGLAEKGYTVEDTPEGPQVRER